MIYIHPTGILVLCDDDLTNSRTQIGGMNACRLSIFGYTEPLKSPLWSTPKTSHGFRNSRPLIAECRPVPRRGCGETGGGDPWRLSTTFLPQQAFTNPNPGLRAYHLSAEGRATAPCPLLNSGLSFHSSLLPSSLADGHIYY